MGNKEDVLVDTILKISIRNQNLDFDVNTNLFSRVSEHNKELES